MIDVIIPAYNSHDTIDIPLLSLSNQNISKQLNVYIVNDGSDEDYKNFIKFYKNFFNSMKELKIKTNQGSGYARRYGINNSNSEYIVFLDSDDSFNTPFSLNSLYQTIKYNNYDMVISNIIEETKNGFLKRNFEDEWLHGKIYNRKYLIDNNIEFNDSRIMEDIAFNKSIILQNSNIGYLNEVTYVWKYNKKSITRRDKDFIYNTIGNLVFNSLFAIKKALENDPNIEKISAYIYEIIIYFYIYYINSNNKKYFKNDYNLLFELIELSEKYKVDNDSKRIIIKKVIDGVIEQFNFDILNIINSKIKLNDFIDYIKKEVKND